MFLVVLCRRLWTESLTCTAWFCCEMFFFEVKILFLGSDSLFEKKFMIFGFD